MTNIFNLEITLFLLFMGISSILYSQSMSTQEDSLRASEILQKANIEATNKVVSLNPNELQLDLTEKEVLKVVEIILFSTYGKVQIRKQKPFHVFKEGKYWIAWGNIKTHKRGGVFEIVVNAENLCVEYLSHSK